jgi:hypothetical protein
MKLALLLLLTSGCVTTHIKWQTDIDQSVDSAGCYTHIPSRHELTLMTARKCKEIIERNR